MTIDGLPLGTFGPLVFVVVLIVLAFMRGWVVPQHVYDAEREDKRQWREAFFDEQKAHAATTAQNGELLEVGRLQRARIEAAETTKEPS